ncbi:hypothetical protein BKA62DRAFT_669181 [Auriculariales sp. MPI-PUGE-AT-0066]|nr:hypothetical protein BKA62DRAFT_669181 [Auriculariales sp. MPI-PUGE-AT-0066]
MSQKKSSNTAKPGKVVKRGGLKPARPILNSTATKLIVSQDSNPSGARSGPALDSLKSAGNTGDGRAQASSQRPRKRACNVSEALALLSNGSSSDTSGSNLALRGPDFEEESVEEAPSKAEKTGRSRSRATRKSIQTENPGHARWSDDSDEQESEMVPRSKKLLPEATLPRVPHSSSRAQRLKARQQAVVGLDSQAKNDDGRQTEQISARVHSPRDFGTAMDVLVSGCCDEVLSAKLPGGPGKSDVRYPYNAPGDLTTDIVWTTGRKTKQSASVHARSHKAIQSDKMRGGDEENAAHMFPICDNPLPIPRTRTRNPMTTTLIDQKEVMPKAPLTLETKCLIDAAMDRLQAELENIAREACRRPNSYNLFIKQYTAKYPKGEHELLILNVNQKLLRKPFAPFAEAYRKYTQEHANEEAEDGYGWKRIDSSSAGGLKSWLVITIVSRNRRFWRDFQACGLATRRHNALPPCSPVFRTKKWLEDQAHPLSAALDQFSMGRNVRDCQIHNSSALTTPQSSGHRDGEKEVSDYSRKEVNRMISSGSATAKSDLRTRLRRILKSLSFLWFIHTFKAAIMSLPAHSVPWSTFVQTLVNTRMAVLGWAPRLRYHSTRQYFDDTVAQRRQFYKAICPPTPTQDKHLEGADDPPLPEEQMIRGRELNGDECAILNDPARRSELRSVPLWVNEDGAVLISYADVQGIGDIKNKENPSKTELAEQVTKLHSILATCATNFKHRLIGLKKAPAASDDADSDEHRSVDAVLVTDDSVSHAGGERKRRMEKVVRQSKRAPHPKGDAGDSETTGAATGPKAAMPESRVKLSPAKKSASKSAKLLKSDSSAPTQTSIHSTKPVLNRYSRALTSLKAIPPSTAPGTRGSWGAASPTASGWRRRFLAGAAKHVRHDLHLARHPPLESVPRAYQSTSRLPHNSSGKDNFRRQRSPSFEPDHEIARPIPMHSPQHRHAVPRDFYSTRKQFRRQHFDEDDGLSGDGDEHQYNPYNYRFEPSHSGYGPQSVARHYTGHTRDESRHVPYGSRMPREHWDDHDDSMSRTTNDWHGHRRSRLAGWVSGPDHGSQRARDFPETGGVSHGAAPLFQRAPVRGQPTRTLRKLDTMQSLPRITTPVVHHGLVLWLPDSSEEEYEWKVVLWQWSHSIPCGSMNTGTSNNSNQFGAAVSYVDPVHGPGLPLPSMNTSQLGVFNSDPWMLPGVDGLGNQTIPGSATLNARTHHQIAQSGVSLNNTYGLGAQPHQLPTTASTLEMFSPARSNMSENLSGDAVGPTRPTSALSTFTHASHSIPGTTPLISSSLPSTSGSSSHMASTLNGDSEVLGSPWNEFGAGFGANS